MATILLCGVDVFFRGKLEALLPGHHFVTSDSADWPDLVIADISRVDPGDVADSYPDVPIVGFGGHTDTAGLRRAHEAGFDQVLVKNALQERASQILKEATTMAQRYELGVTTRTHANAAPERAIIQEIDSIGAEMVVMGVDRLIGDVLDFGSVATAVLAQSSAPVLLVSTEAGPPARPATAKP